VVVIAYRLTSHPLAQYPGSWFSKVSGFSIAYLASTGNRHLQPLKEHENDGNSGAHQIDSRPLAQSMSAGPIVRIGPNAVSINTISALKEIDGNRKANVQKTG